MARRTKRSNKTYQNKVKTTPQAKPVRYIAARVGRPNPRLTWKYNYRSSRVIDNIKIKKTSTTITSLQKNPTPRVKAESLGSVITTSTNPTPSSQSKRMRKCVERPNPNSGGGSQKQKKGEKTERKFVRWC